LYVLNRRSTSSNHSNALATNAAASTPAGACATSTAIAVPINISTRCIACAPNAQPADFSTAANAALYASEVYVAPETVAMLALCAASASERRVGHAFVVQYCGELESYAAVIAVIRCPEIVTVSVRVPYRSLDDALYVPSRGPLGVGFGVGVAVGFGVDFVGGGVERPEVGDGCVDV